MLTSEKKNSIPKEQVRLTNLRLANFCLLVTSNVAVQCKLHRRFYTNLQLPLDCIFMAVEAEPVSWQEKLERLPVLLPDGDSQKRRARHRMRRSCNPFSCAQRRFA